jgi:hypothetical protein
VEIFRSLLRSIYSVESGHPKVPLKPLDAAKVLWINERVSRQRERCTDNASHYKPLSTRSLRRDCAFELSSAGDDQAGDRQIWGLADRYGGPGLANNGGSGRSVYVNDYLVKGIGPTPLVSMMSPECHRTGVAYLEECVREAVFSEIVDLEFPFGSVPTLAVIDTGRTHLPPHQSTPSPERTALLVRPPFFRVAHLLRATSFVSSYVNEGTLDQARVLEVLRLAIGEYGNEGLVEEFYRLLERLTHQMAYSFVHRLPHGAVLPSNVAFDGRLVDFGAMTAVPSWARTATVIFAESFEDRFACIPAIVRLIGYYFNRYVDRGLGSEEWAHRLENKFHDLFLKKTAFEVLRLLGVPNAVAAAAVEGRDGARVIRAVKQVITWYQGESIDFFDDGYRQNIEWDLCRVWDDRPPQHLRFLSFIVRELTTDTSIDRAARKCTERTKSREFLYKFVFRRRFFEAVHQIEPLAPHADGSAVSAYISSVVAACRRDENRCGL